MRPVPPVVSVPLPVISSMISPTTPLPVLFVALSVPEGVVGRLLGAVLGMVVGMVAAVVLGVLGRVLGAVVSLLLRLQPVSRHVVRTSVKATITVFFISYLLYSWDSMTSMTWVCKSSHVIFPENRSYFGKKQKNNFYPLLFWKSSIIITGIKYIKENPLL